MALCGVYVAMTNKILFVVVAVAIAAIAIAAADVAAVFVVVRLNYCCALAPIRPSKSH